MQTSERAGTQAEHTLETNGRQQTPPDRNRDTQWRQAGMQRNQPEHLSSMKHCWVVAEFSSLFAEVHNQDTTESKTERVCQNVLAIASGGRPDIDPQHSKA